MASAKQSKKLRILLFPFFATSHIGPFTNLAFHLAAARPDVVEATMAVTPANASVVQSVLAPRGLSRSMVEVATYPFPVVDGLPPGVENLSTVTAADAWRIDAAAMNEMLMRPGQESLIRERSPDVLITDIHFFWNVDFAADLGVPCITFHAIGSFPVLAMLHLMLAGVHDATDGVVTVPGFPSPDIRVPITELPEFLRNQQIIDGATNDRFKSAPNRCLGLAVNTFFDLEHGYCEMYVHDGYVKRAYFVGPLSLPLPQATASTGSSQCIDWLDTKPAQSVVFLCFGSLAHVSEAQLRELALGLEASGKPFLWVVRSRAWAPPEGWEERVGDRGMVVAGWAPQTAILAHPAVGVFVTHCGWNSILETIVAGVPVLTWPMVFEQFITERFATEVLEIGERLSPDGAGVRSTRYEENELIPAVAVARAVARFMEPQGAGDAARSRVKELSAKAHAAMEEGGSSHRDLHRLIDALMDARAAAAGTIP
ncbi:UDP-glycosyltransferase 73C4-like [Phragmites australis]|uniref:UDP-glycosyltransferase 73C4-like n=1 Tax=Phragmites australis TaxID=29695 RepID=UPI002D7852EA|nr:UDP-glycosyltransferase 73C4-like [Phragmites australis]